MPNLIESLQGRDLGHLRIIAGFWGIDLVEQDIKSALLQLTASMLDQSRLENLFSTSSKDEQEALNNLAANGGRLPWAQYTRLYGEIREVGPAKRDREQPYKQPISPAEALWYKGMIGRAFFDTPAGPEEFAYLPEDLGVKLPLAATGDAALMGRRASNSEYARMLPANDVILDHACTFLAALRLGMSVDSQFSTRAGEILTPAILNQLLTACGLIDTAGMLLPEPVRLFLEAGRGEALEQLFKCWRQTSQFNELRLLPNLSADGNWVNDPLNARQAVLAYVMGLPAGTWWSLDSFLAAFKKRSPDFQRPAGDYDSWFIRDLQSGEYLRGFEHWNAVDGKVIHFILTGPLHWLGVLDLATPEGSAEVTAFRLSGWSNALLHGKPPRGLPAEEDTIIARSDARLGIRRLVPRRVRYQLARFCEWSKETPDEYQYQITAASLRSARKQGLTVNQLLTLLNRHSKTVPPSLVKALERWESSGSEARLEKVLILRVTSAEVLQALRKTRASRYLGEPVAPTATIIKPGAAQKVLGALAELGYLGEIRAEEEDKATGIR